MLSFPAGRATALAVILAAFLVGPQDLQARVGSRHVTGGGTFLDGLDNDPPVPSPGRGSARSNGSSKLRILWRMETGG